MSQIDHLIIIGGPSCVGKTHLINKIKQGDCPRLCKQLGINDPSAWRFTWGNNVKNLLQQDIVIERLIVHYDFYQKTQLLKNKKFILLNEVINCNYAKRVDVLTLCAPPKILIQRVNLRILSLFKMSALFPVHNDKVRPFRNQWEKRKMYKNDFSLVLYKNWFNFLSKSSLTRHLLFDSAKSNNVKAYAYENGNSELITGILDVTNSYQGTTP